MKIQKITTRRLLPILLAVLILGAAILPSATLLVYADKSTVVTTPPTGYIQASDVVYETFSVDGISGVMNWGARGEDCTFLSPNAEAYYTEEYSFLLLSLLAGGTQSTAPDSALYAALQAMMVAENDVILGYQDTRSLYAYTDCVSNEPTMLVSFYSGKLHSSVWDSGATWNREHTWPNSKCINTNKTKDSADIMMLRPTLKSENGSRGNKSYGESAGYFDPGASVRGDCARIVLYVYTRWGNTAKMWGSAGVIENVEVLLRWMEEDPVDTWEMGRNDAVESITGVRNVFVDYPEYAWLLFDREVPSDIVTPSGMAAEGNAPDTSPSETQPVTVPETEFEMTQPEPPPVIEPDTEFEMTQPEPPPAVDPVTDFVTTPTTDPVTDFVTTPTTDPAIDSLTDSETEPPTAPATHPATETLSGTDEKKGGCGAMLTGGTVAMLSLSALSFLFIRPAKRREE